MTPWLFTLGLAGAAFVTAALSGLAGLGGGTILIGLFFALGMPPTEAVPLFAAVQLVSNASRTVAYVGHVHWGATGWFLLAAVPATFLLAPWMEYVNPDAVQVLLALLILFSLLPLGASGGALPARLSFVLAGLLNGGLGMLTGATGLFVGRLFLRPEWRRETTIGTLALTQGLGHALRVLAYGWAGFSAFSNPGRLLPLCLAVIAGTLAGKWLNTHLDEARFAYGFKSLLILLSLKLLWDGTSAFL